MSTFLMFYNNHNGNNTYNNGFAFSTECTLHLKISEDALKRWLVFPRFRTVIHFEYQRFTLVRSRTSKTGFVRVSRCPSGHQLFLQRIGCRRKIIGSGSRTGVSDGRIDRQS